METSAEQYLHFIDGIVLFLQDTVVLKMLLWCEQLVQRAIFTMFQIDNHFLTDEC